MKSTVEPLEGNKVKVSVEVDDAEFERELDQAFKRIAREVRIPGFRPGKVPRKILEARVGVDAARGEALQHSVPEFYARAVHEHDVDVIAPPEIDLTSGEEAGPVAFDAVVEVRPQVVVGGYRSLRVTIERPEATDEEVEGRIDRLRDQFGQLTTVERPAIDGDHVTIDISGSQHGEPLAGLTATDYLYEVGIGAVVPELDEQLRGAKPGEVLSFEAPHPDPDEDTTLSFRILVKEVQDKVLPEPDDAFAAEASEFDTMDELRADLAKRLATVKKVQAQMSLQEKTAEALAGLVDEEVPEALVNTEMQSRLQDLAMRLQAQGMGIEEWLAQSGTDGKELIDELKETAAQAVKVDLALRAVAEAEDIEVDDDDLESEYAAVAERVGQRPEQVRRQFERNEQVSLVRSDVKKRKALEWLVEQIEIVDNEGAPIDRNLLEIEEPSAPDDTESDVAADLDAGTVDEGSTGHAATTEDDE